MQTIAERGHAAMQWLLVLGLIAGWAALDRPPPVVETGLAIVDRCLIHPEYLGLADPLAELPREAQAPLSQYRHEFLHQGLEYDAFFLPGKRQAIGQMTVGSLLTLSQHVVRTAEQRGSSELLLAPLRDYQAKLETWQQKSSLGPSATLLDIETEISSRVQIPGTEQTIALEQCLVFVALGIIALELYLCSLLATLLQLPAGAEVDFSWVLLHRPPLGPVLTVTWLVLPGLVWVFHQATTNTRSNRGAVVMLSAAIFAATILALRQTFRVRRRFLSPPAERTLPIAAAAARAA